MTTHGPADHPVFMVEAYRSADVAGGATDPRRIEIDVDGTVVVGVIDIPSDEVALFLVVAADSLAAGEVVRERGLRPIRVVPASWDAVPGGRGAMSDPESGRG